MKKLIILAVLAALANGEIVTVISNGVERKINIPGTKLNKARKAVHGGEGIIIAFKKEKSVNVPEFAKKYSLILKKKLIAGYYIFENNSTYSDLSLISQIIKDQNSTIKTIRPNWGFGNQPK